MSSSSINDFLLFMKRCSATELKAVFRFLKYHKSSNGVRIHVVKKLRHKNSNLSDISKQDQYITTYQLESSYCLSILSTINCSLWVKINHINHLFYSLITQRIIKYTIIIINKPI